METEARESYPGLSLSQQTTNSQPECLSMRRQEHNDTASISHLPEADLSSEEERVGIRVPISCQTLIHILPFSMPIQYSRKVREHGKVLP